MATALVYRKGHRQYRTLMDKPPEQLLQEGYTHVVQFSVENLDVATDNIKSARIISTLYDGLIGIFKLKRDGSEVILVEVE
ncbi:hypothetical protein SP15_173 [Bacillus phage SP-15]|uniref:Uncharacterized protein n=1 Tax=Bacillus phage SP-15 TaxID=1792032 RepID=A0A127AYY2_9CAUD|nr:hypothetical protein SP15_173 [Bacillus phage SP-15]AMM44971.1 hypothetical protein SP15_173 [Bacillus phage SP-15]